jgi:hypothetical protein
MNLLRQLGLRLGLVKHSHIYRWSEIKAERQGGPRPRCRFCRRRA